jgi:uncharacterized DUF497 family protein
MDFDWIDPPFDIRKVSPKEIEESFEDPFSLRMLPEFDSGERAARYLCLGRTLANRGLFSVFWTDGKSFRVICARDMTAEESAFYDRKNAENI